MGREHQVVVVVEEDGERVSRAVTVRAEKGATRQEIEDLAIQKIQESNKQVNRETITGTSVTDTDMPEDTSHDYGPDDYEGVDNEEVDEG